MNVCSDNKGSHTCINWTRPMKIFAIFSAIDLSIQSKFLQEWTETYLSGENFSRNQDTFTTNKSDQTTSIPSFTGNHLFYSAVFRLLFVTYFCHISYDKSIPKKIQPFMGYILSAILYLVCSCSVNISNKLRTFRQIHHSLHNLLAT